MLYFGTLTVLKHDAFQTTAFDLGNVDQAVWNTRHGRLLAMTNIEGLTNRLGTHVEPILVPISLLYFVWSDPRILLLLQTVVMALGAWPAYLLARRALSKAAAPPGAAAGRLMAHVLPVLFAFAYLMFPALQSANVFDFHAVALAPTFFLLALYCLETERWGAFAAWAVLTMSTKEDMPLLVAMLGVYVLVRSRGRRWPIGLGTIAAAAAWFVVAVGVVMPHFDTSAVSPLASRYEWLGDGPAEMARTLVTRPGLVAAQALTAENLAYVRDWLAPVAYLPLLAPPVLLLAAPVLAVNLLSTDGFMHQLEGFHYGVLLAPIAVVGAAYGAAWLLGRVRRARLAQWLAVLLAVAVAAATMGYHYGHGYTPLATGRALSWPQVTEHDRLGADMARRIPGEASLAALAFLNPHASQRERLAVIDRVEMSGESAELAPGQGADYLWLDVTNSWPLHPNDLKTAASSLLAGDYGVAEAADGYLLLERGLAVKDLPAAFFDFCRVADAQPQYPMRVQFLLDGQPALELLGLDLEQEDDGWVATTYWRALRALPAGLRLYPFYVDDASGQVLEDTTLRPMIAAVWYPPERWQPGEMIKTSTLPWPVGPEFSLGVGVVQGNDWQAAERRLPIRVEASDVVIRLLDGNSWARLLHVEGGRPVAERRVLSAPAPQVPLAADLGPVRLLGYDVKSSPSGKSAAGDALRATLYWQAEERMETGYSVFVQLLDGEGRVRGQVDAVPQAGGYPTFWWLPGEVVADAVTVTPAPDTPPGLPLRAIAGLYDPATGVRLVDQTTGLDHVELGAVP